MFASRTKSQLARRAVALGAAGLLTVGFAATSASAVPNVCPRSEIVTVWHGGTLGSHAVCPDLPEYLSHLFYPGTMYTTALAHSYRANVVVIQLRLRDLGYSPVAVDGKYGPQTAGAVKRYQHRHHLIEDGKVGLQTWKSLFGLGAA